MSKARRRTKRRERRLGMAIALGLLASLAVSLGIFLIALRVPGSTLYNLFGLIYHDSSATLAFDPLYRQYVDAFNREEALFYEPLALFCGGLTLGGLAPHYATLKRVLWASVWMAAGLLFVSLAFTWSVALYETNLLAVNEGGTVTQKTAPLDYILNTLLWHVSWVVVCVLGSYCGQRLRDRRASSDPSAPALRPVQH